MLAACIGCQYPRDHAFHNCTKHRAALAVLMWIPGQESPGEQHLRKTGGFVALQVLFLIVPDCK